MGLPSPRHAARTGIRALGLLSEPSQGQNPPALASGCVEAGADLCQATPRGATGWRRVRSGLC